MSSKSLEYNVLLEHGAVKRRLEDEENNKGSIPVYQVEIAEGAVSSTFADMPAKTCEAYFIDGGFLVPNEMDDYARYQLLPAEALASEPVFLRNDMPQMDAMIMADQKKREANNAYLMEKTKNREVFFNRANAFNQLFGDIFDVPASFDAYLESLSASELGQPAPECPDPTHLQSQAQRYHDVTGKNFQPPKVTVQGPPKHQASLIRLAAIKQSLDEQIFEAENRFSVEAVVMKDDQFAVKVLNPAGTVIESAVLDLEEGDVTVNGDNFYAHYLEVDFHNKFFRYGKPIEASESLLAEVLKDYEKGCFDFSRDVPEYQSDEGAPIYGIDDVRGVQLYDHMLESHPDIVGKFSMMADASMKRENRQDHTVTPTPATT